MRRGDAVIVLRFCSDGTGPCARSTGKVRNAVTRRMPALDTGSALTVGIRAGFLFVRLPQRDPSTFLRRFECVSEHSDQARLDGSNNERIENEREEPPPDANHALKQRKRNGCDDDDPDNVATDRGAFAKQFVAVRATKWSHDADESVVNRFGADGA